jgi:hypothetical protein
MRNWWNNTKNYIEQKGMIWVSLFVGLCWFYFAFLIEPGTASLTLFFAAVVIVAILAYRFLRLFMR